MTKVAIVCESLFAEDWGVEVASVLLSLYPEADFYALTCDFKNLPHAKLRHQKIHVSYLRGLVKKNSDFASWGFLAPSALKSLFGKKKYEMVISLTRGLAHLISFSGKHLIYFYDTPYLFKKMRFARYVEAQQEKRAFVSNNHFIVSSEVHRQKMLEKKIISQASQVLLPLLVTETCSTAQEREDALKRRKIVCQEEEGLPRKALQEMAQGATPILEKSEQNQEFFHGDFVLWQGEEGLDSATAKDPGTMRRYALRFAKAAFKQRLARTVANVF